jgi:hypothetical protein
VEHTIKTYWDLSERERSELTREHVEGFLDVELMTKGVRKVGAAPPEAALPSIPAPIIMYGWKVGYDNSDIVVAMRESAEDARTADARWAEYDYELGIRIVRPLGQVVEVEVHPADVVERYRSDIAHCKAARESFEKQSSEHKRALDAQRKVLDGVWADWFRCQAKASEQRAIGATWARYVETSRGDKAAALRFIRLIHTDDELATADAWCQLGMPLGPMPDVAPECSDGDDCPDALAH